MSIAAEKINESAFYGVYGLLKDFKWLQHSIDPLIELWNTCDEKGQQELVKDLFGRFTFIDGYQLEGLANDIYRKVIDWGFSPPNTLISAIADKDEVDGSIAGLQFIKNKFPAEKGWKEKYFIPSIVQVAHQAKNNDSIVLFDDFLGSGKTLKNKIEYLRKVLQERNIKPNSIKVVAYAGMEFGISDVASCSGLEVYSPIILKKGLTDFEDPKVLPEKIEQMISLEKKLGEKFKRLRLKDHSLGYRRSEALFQIQGYNCPNNLFPIFWWPTFSDNKVRNTLFKRAR